MAVRGDGQGAGGLVGGQGQGLVAQLGGLTVLPAADLQAGGLDAGRREGADPQATSRRVVQTAGAQPLFLAPRAEGLAELGPLIAVDAAGVVAQFVQALLQQPGLVDLAGEEALGIEIEHHLLITAIA